MYNGFEYADGGLCENVPWHDFENIGINNVICVTFREKGNMECCRDVVNILSNSFEILLKEIEECETKGIENEIVIEHEKVGLLDASKIDVLYEAGYEKGLQFLTEFVGGRKQDILT